MAERGRAAPIAAPGPATEVVLYYPDNGVTQNFMPQLFFPGIYFPQKGAWRWVKLIAQNRGSVWHVIRDSFTQWHGAHDRNTVQDSNGSPSSARGMRRSQAEAEAD